MEDNPHQQGADAVLRAIKLKGTGVIRNHSNIHRVLQIITPQTEITLTNTKTGQEYNSDAEAMQDVQDSNTDTVADDIKRDVKVTVEALPIGGDSKL